MFKKTGIYLGVAIAIGFCFHAGSSAADESNQTPLMIVVESQNWLGAIEQLAGDESEICCWTSERPDWFLCRPSNAQRILLLTNPNDQTMAKELWRERLQNQGCAVYPIKLQRARSLANTADLLRSLHRSLIACCPEKTTTWDRNLEQALLHLQHLHVIAYLSSREFLTEK